MRKLFQSPVRRLVLFLFLAASAAVGLRFAFAEEKTEAIGIDEYEYADLMEYTVGSLADLRDWASSVQSDFLPIAPPFADLTFTQEWFSPVLPIDLKSLPRDFAKGLSGYYENTVPVYPVTIVEDPMTREMAVFNFDREYIGSLAAQTGYDPYAFVKYRMPWLYSGGANAAGRAYLEGIYDPARIVLRTKLIESGDLAHWLYARDQIAAVAEMETEQYMMLMEEASMTNMQFTEIRKLTNGLSLSVTFTNTFTNGLDIFTCNDLMAEVWSIAARNLATTGTNLTWLDTNAWVFSGNPVRFYAAADATTDADGDGYADGREIMVYGTDPNSATSHPVTVSGTVSYGGPESGTIYVLFNTDSNSWSTAKSIALSIPGAYTNDEIANNQSFWFSAFRDVNGSFAFDAWEPWGIYTQSPTPITGTVSGIDIAMQDVPSVWGTIDYTGDATGDIHVIAVTASNSWDTTYETVIPWVQSVGLTGEEYYVVFPANYSIVGLPASNYWIRAFMDEDTNLVFTTGEPGGVCGTNSILVSNRVTGVNVTLDLDSDGDGMPDWWEIQYGLDPFDDGSIDPDSGSDGDPDGDGWTNGEEFGLGSNPQSLAKNGHQLAAALMRANLRVSVEDSDNCDGSNAGPQQDSDLFQVGPLEGCGYILSITAEGNAERQDAGYDFTSINDVEYFSSDKDDLGCAMVEKQATHNILAVDTGTITLQYDTVDGLYHQGAYAEITDVQFVGVLKVELEKCSSSFEPNGGDADNTTTIRAFVTPSGLQGKFNFTLTGISSEPGYCLNVPKPAPGSGEDSDAWKDLQFPDQTGFTISGTDRDVAATTATDLNEATVTIKSYDYGAYGQIKAEFIPNGTGPSCTATEQGGSKEYTNIPRDDDENHIWDGWASYTGTAVADTDKNSDGTLWGTDGDGLSAYEEYRGVVYVTTHHRLDAVTKDVFIYNPDLVYGVTSFGGIAGVNRIPVGDVFSATGVINFNSETAHVVDQHVLKVERTDLGGMWEWGRVIQPPCAPNSPKDSGTVQIDEVQIAADCDYRDNDFITHVACHELSHAVGGEHHGVLCSSPFDPPLDCIMRDPKQDAQNAGSEAEWNAIQLGVTWVDERGNQRISDE